MVTIYSFGWGRSKPGVHFNSSHCWKAAKHHLQGWHGFLHFVPLSSLRTNSKSFSGDADDEDGTSIKLALNRTLLLMLHNVSGQDSPLPASIRHPESSLYRSTVAIGYRRAGFQCGFQAPWNKACVTAIVHILVNLRWIPTAGASFFLKGCLSWWASIAASILRIKVRTTSKKFHCMQHRDKPKGEVLKTIADRSMFWYPLGFVNVVCGTGGRGMGKQRLNRDSATAG